MGGVTRGSSAYLDALVSSRAAPADVTAARDSINANVDAADSALAVLIGQRATPADVTAARDSINANVDGAEAALTTIINQRATPAQVAAAQMTGIIKSVQRGAITMTSVASNTATVAAVNTAKSVLIMMGCTSGSTSIDQALCSLALTNSTTITATKGNAVSTATAYYELVEFY